MTLISALYIVGIATVGDDHFLDNIAKFAHLLPPWLDAVLGILFEAKCPSRFIEKLYFCEVRMKLLTYNDERKESFNVKKNIRIRGYKFMMKQTWGIAAKKLSSEINNQ